jgi:excisionase family DNA binding protein
MMSEVMSLGEGLVTVKEASKLLSLSRSTLYLMMDRGELRYAKIGGARRIPKQALSRLVHDSLIGGWKLPEVNG